MKSYLLRQLPTVTSQKYHACLFQLLLGRSDRVLPLLSKVDTINHSVNCIIAEVRLNLLDQGVQLDSRKWAFLFK